MTDQLMTQEEVAEFFNVTVSAVRKWRSKGLIPFMRVGNTVRFDRREVVAFYERHRVETPCSSPAAAVG